MNAHRLFAFAALAALGACSQEQEDRAAERTSQAVRESNQALRGLAEKTREGTEQAAAIAKEGAREARAALSDGTVTAKVKAALLADATVDATRIDVDTAGGVVTLSGLLPDPAQIGRARDIAARVQGVRAVENKLQAAPAG